MIYKIKQRMKRYSKVKKLYDTFRIRSILWALKKQKLTLRFNQLKELDLVSDQYTTASIDTEYLKTKVLGLHAFQVSLFLEFMQSQTGKEWKIIDLGDSSGNHILYMKELFKEYDFKSISINLDEEAIRKIKGKGLNYATTSIEDYLNVIGRPKELREVALLLQTLEHLENPISVLKGVKEQKVDGFIITVPFVKRSRIGMHHLRNNFRSNLLKEPNIENTHIFELSPDDWNVLFKYCGWEVEYQKVYYQFPVNLPIISLLLRWYWQLFDFEGFYGCILKK